MNMSAEQFNMRMKKLARWIDDNGDKVESYRRRIAVIVGLLLMSAAFHLGNANLRLILDGVEAQGKIVAHQQYSSRSNATAYMPIVEFQVGDRVVRFTDRSGSQSTSMGLVPVLYNPVDPSVAMIDRPVLNWMPWAPLFVVGLILVLVSIKNRVKFNNAEPHGQLNELNPEFPGLRLPEPELPDADDQIACKVSWEPAKSGGANFRTQKMTVLGSQVVIERSGAAMRFCLSFVLLGLVAQAIGGLLIFRNGQFGGGVFMIAAGLFFEAVAALLLIGDKKIIFDKSAGVYFRGKAFDHSNSPHRSQQGRLADIHAVQLVDEQIKSRSADRSLSTYTSYEMNLVFKDGDRLNVMDHGIEKEVEESARRLGEFLGVPIWRQADRNSQ